MHRHIRTSVLALALAAACAVPVLAPAAPAAPAAAARSAVQALQPGTYKIDVAHSHVHFVVSHLGISNFVGRFDDLQGSFVIGDKPVSSKVSATIPVASINTKHQKLEEHLKSPDFFDAAQFPTMSFESTRVRWNERGEGTLSGNLTLHGVTKPVDFALSVTGAGKGPRGDTRAGFEAKLTIKRSDFGMNYGLPKVVGDTVEILLSVEGILQAG